MPSLRRVVGAEDRDARAHAHDRLQDHRDQVRLGVVVFAERAVHRAAAGVEVAQGGELEVFQLETWQSCSICSTISLLRPYGLTGAFFSSSVIGTRVGVAVDGAGAGEDEPVHARLLHRLAAR